MPKPCAPTTSGGRSQCQCPAASETIANGVGIYSSSPAVSLFQVFLGNFMPLIGTSEMTPQEALKASAAGYTKEAIAQGYLP
ncbi:MAG: hypothetical protein QGD88_06775 [Anaerolineae bacterium]|nr:hypothetical protein [Anaerolineae bacterium]